MLQIISVFTTFYISQFYVRMSYNGGILEISFMFFFFFLLQSLFDQNLIIIYYKPNDDFNNHIILRGTQGGLVFYFSICKNYYLFNLLV
jgi:hypothetical protein